MHIRTEGIPSPSSDFIEKRRSPRMRVCVPVTLVWINGDREHAEQTHSLSISWFGCTVRSRVFFQLGVTVRLRRDDGKEINALVIYCLGDRAEHSVEIGLKFEDDGRAFWEMPAWRDQ